jgi:hypothetical protein
MQKRIDHDDRLGRGQGMADHGGSEPFAFGPDLSDATHP